MSRFFIERIIRGMFQNLSLYFSFPELEAAVREKDMATSECDHLRKRTEALMTDNEQEKREKFETSVSQA